MLRKRLITVLTFYEGVLFRSKLFTPDYRYTPNFVDAWSVDEIVILDITRPERRNQEQFLELVKAFSTRCFVPVCAGGGVKSVSDFTRYLDAGADKICVNTLLHTQPSIISQAANRFGSQCVVASIDAKRVGDSYRVYKNCGREMTQWSPESLAIRAEVVGAGEIFLTSIDKDGSLEGYDNELNQRVAQAVSIPVVVCGGAGKWQDLVDGFVKGGADAVATTNIYHFTETSIKSAKNFLARVGISVRV